MVVVARLGAMKDIHKIHINAGRASSFLKGLANENRLVILCALAEGERNVGDLENVLGIRQPTLSQQLARLRSDGMVATRRDKKQIYYSLASEEAKMVLGLIFKISCSKENTEADPGASSLLANSEAA